MTCLEELKSSAPSANDTEGGVMPEESVEGVISRYTPMLSLPSRADNIQALTAFHKLVSCNDVSSNLEGILSPLKGLGRISFASRDDCVVTKMLYDLMDFVVRDYHVLVFVPTLSKLLLRALQDAKDPSMRTAMFQWFGGVCATEEGIPTMGDEMCIEILERILAFAMDIDDGAGGMHQPTGNFPTPETSDDENAMIGVDVVDNNIPEEASGSDLQEVGEGADVKLNEKLQSFLTLLECLQFMPREMLGPYYQNIVVAFSNAFESTSWELRRLAINGLTKITEFSESITLEDAHFEPTTSAIINAANNLINSLTSKPQCDENPHVVVAGLDFLKTALTLYGRDIFGKFPSAKYRIQKILFESFGQDAPLDFNYGRMEMEENLVLGALNCVRPLRELILSAEFKDFYEQMRPPIMEAALMRPLDIRRIVGLIAESAQVVKGDFFESTMSTGNIRNLLQVAIGHEDAEVRSDTVHAIGEMLAHGGPKFNSMIPTILGYLRGMAYTESEPEVMDDIVIAHAKLILLNFRGIRGDGMVEVLTVMMPNIPLKVRLMENQILFDCFQSLFIHSKELIKLFIPQIMGTIYSILSMKENFDHYGRCKKAATIFYNVENLRRFISANYASHL